MRLSQYYSVVLNVPAETRKKMTRTHDRLLDLLVRMMKVTSKLSPSGAYYCFPTQLWLSNQLFVTREWVNVCIRDLREWGLLIVIHRFDNMGRYRSNIYKIGLLLAQVLRDLREWKTSFTLLVKRSKHILSNKVYTKTYKDVKENLLDREFNDSLTKVLDRLKEKAQKSGRWEAPTT